VNYQDMKNDEVLAAVGTFGPGMVGHYLFERAQWILANDPSGSFGPGLIGSYVPSEKAKADLRERGMLRVVAEDEGLEKPSAEAVLEYAGLAPKRRPRKES